MIKAKFGERLWSKTEVAQTNEMLLKVVCHNICCVIRSMHELELEPTFWAASRPPQSPSLLQKSVTRYKSVTFWADAPFAQKVF